MLLLNFVEILSLLVVGLELSPILNIQQVLSLNWNSLKNKTCEDIDEHFYPTIKVQHGDEIHNSSFNLNEASDVLNEHSGYSFSITCISYYPIEWVVNYFYNGYPNGKAFGLHLQLYRKFSNYKDPSTYKFIISSKMRYKNTHGFKNFSFSCRSVHRPLCLQTLLYTSIEEDNKCNRNTVNIIPMISGGKEPVTEVIDEGKSKTSEVESEDSACDFKVYHKNLGWNHYGLQCEFKDGTPGTVKVIHQCSNAISCMSFHQQHLQPLLAEECVTELPTNISCHNCSEREFRLSQGFLACVSEEFHPHQPEDKLLFFFSSVPQDNPEHSGKLYFNMDQVNTSHMISLERINKKVTIGDQMTITCNTSTYAFAAGTKLALKHKGSDELHFLKSILVLHGGTGGDNFPANVYEANIPITTDTIERIYCIAPIWNKFTWVNKSYPIHVLGITILSSEKSSSPHVVVAVSVTLLVTTLFCCLLFGLCWMKVLKRKLSKFGKLLTPQEIDEFRRKPLIINGERLNNDYAEYINANILNTTNENFQYMEINRELLQLDETVVLGKGHFGKVLKGVYKDERTGEKIYVAVKTLKTKTDVGALKSLLSELKIMATVGKNVNVVNLVGACTKRMEKGEVYVAVEYCANGNMQHFLQANRNKFKNQLQRDILIVEIPYSVDKCGSDDTISSLDLIKWSWEIAKGMEFLSSKKVIHGDLATRNVLLTIENVAKVSDFGLSRQLVDYYYVKEESGPMPYRWMSIEALRDMKFSVQSDIWSCGVTLWELFTLAEVPYYGCCWSAEFVQALDSGHRLGKPQYATSEMYELMRNCWKEDPNDRPSFFTIKMFFEDIITQCTYQDYMQLDLIGTRHNPQSDCSRTPLLTLTPTVEAVSDCEVDDDVFEQ